MSTTNTIFQFGVDPTEVFFVTGIAGYTKPTYGAARKNFDTFRYGPLIVPSGYELVIRKEGPYIKIICREHGPFDDPEYWGPAVDREVPG